MCGFKPEVHVQTENNLNISSHVTELIGVRFSLSVSCVSPPLVPIYG